MSDRSAILVPGDADAAIEALKAIRLRLRLILAAEAVARLLVAVVIVIAVIAALDWLVGFPSYVRLALLLVSASTASVWVCRRIARPLFGEIPLDQLALGLKGISPELRDELASAVAYLHGAGDGSKEMWGRVLAQIGASVPDLRHRGLLSLRGLATAWLLLMSVALPVVVLGFVSPGVVRIAVVRVGHPLSGIEWPRRKEIEALTGDAIVALGESFSAEMQLVRGDKPSVRGYLHWRAGGESQFALMRRDPDGVYRMTLDGLREPTRYYFSAGDDDTSMRPSLIRVVERPGMASIRLEATPPDYASHLSMNRDSFDDREAEVLEGSRVALVMRTNKPIEPGGASIIRLIPFEGAEVALPIVSDGDNRLKVEFTAGTSLKFEPELIDGHGLKSRGGDSYRLLVRPDEPPTIAIQQPEGLIEATVDATIAIRVKAADDIGLEQVTLVAGRPGSAHVSIFEQAGRAPDSGAPERELVASYEWSLKAFGAVTGEIIEYYAEARDGFSLDGRLHPPVRSPVGRVRVVSSSRMAEKLRLDLLSVREQLRRMLTEMQGSMKRTAALEVGPAARIALTEAQKSDARQIAGELERLGLSAVSTADALARIVREAQMNAENQSTTAQQARRIAGALMRDSSAAARQAQETMAKAAESSRVEAQVSNLRASAVSQTDFAESLRMMLSEMERWNQYDDLVRQLREVLDRQEGLEREFTAAGRTPRSEAGESAVMDEERRRTESTLAQSLLRSDTADLLVAMDSFARTKEAEDRLAAESVRAALVVANQEGVLERMDEAAGAGQAGQFARATEYQRNAAAGLRAVLAALDSKPDRELAELSRDLKNIMNRLERLIAGQQTVIEKTQGAVVDGEPAEAYELLADRQFSLQTTSRSLERLLKTEQPNAQSVRKMIAGASKEMGSAGELLETLSGEESLERQFAAREGLEKAREELMRIEEHVDQEIGQRSLDAIVEALKGVRAKQQAVRTDTADIASRASTDGDLTRPDMLRLARLGKLQRELSEPLVPLVEKIRESVVYAHVLDRVIERIERAASLLAAQSVHASVKEQDQIIRDLGWLIDAVDEREREDDPTFVQDSIDAGGGAAGQPTASKPVPTLAELRVLRAMQVDLNKQTAVVSREMGAGEARVREVEALGKAQADVRDLASQMISEAKKKEGQ